MTEPLYFYDQAALLERLSKGLNKRGQEVVFLVGSPLSAPLQPGAPGVPSVNGIIDLIRREFDDDVAQVTALDQALDAAGPNRYQSAFLFLQGRRGQQTANEIVRDAVLAARVSPPGIPATCANPSANDESYRLMDLDNRGWFLSPGTEALGKLIAAYPDRFGRSVLTTNFDPLIEVAIQRASGNYFRTTLHADGNLSQTAGTGCHVIHLHGYWYGSDTLHTGRQLGQSRPRLKASLSSLLRHKLVVVCAYGGWDDAFTEALMEVVRDDTAYPEIIWTFHSGDPGVSESLSDRLAVGIGRGRVNLYAGIDCHEFIPMLYEAWLSLAPPAAPPSPSQTNPVRVSSTLLEQFTNRPAQKRILEGDDEDRPPVVEICVGRERELQIIKSSPARITFITGFGGQGKSTLAAQYFSDSLNDKFGYSFYVWRDCKEESERFENQLASVIEKLSDGKISGEDLAKQNSASIVEILIGLIKDVDALFVFDNADHYVDIESRRMTGSAHELIQALLHSGSHSRVIFTCRPIINYDDPLTLSCHLEGLDLEATRKLFSQRGASANQTEIEDAHHLTDGHAFWLDLLAIQVTKRSPKIDLGALVNEIRSGRGELPAKTLNSIWSTLNEREQKVLRAMAETVRPDTEVEISDYLSHELNYNKVAKALRALRALNLVVIKRQQNGPDFLELHPLVRQFIRQRFRRDEQFSFINAIIRAYKRYIESHRSHLTERPSLSILQYWTQNAELDIAAGKIGDAFLTLAEAAVPFMTSAYPREFARVTRLLLSKANWVVDHTKYKTFEQVFKAQAWVLSFLGEYQEVDNLLDMYEETVPNRDGRYINYCGLRCTSKWVRGEFTSAVDWGKIGKNLKDSSDIDIESDVAHELALAERDAGQPESALPVFLDGRHLSEVTDPDELDEDRDGAHYGNIGRCLHFMGQIDSALVCYQKSALLIETDSAREHVMNQAYIRLWIGELLAAREHYRLAYVFFLAARAKWKNISPPKAQNVTLIASQIRDHVKDFAQIDDSGAEKICHDWILGRSVDS